MVLYINCAIHAPGVKFGHTPGVGSLHRLISFSFYSADRNECDLTVCSQSCTNTEGSYSCGCYTGYQLENDGKTCSGMAAVYLIG